MTQISDREKMTQVIAAIIQKEGRVLICQRGAGGSCAYLWEFPGGKLEKGETLQECLIRECQEELGIEICVGNIFAETTHRYPEREIAFTFFWAEILKGEIIPTVHADIRWVLPGEMNRYEFCPADVEIVKQLVRTLTT